MTISMNMRTPLRPGTVFQTLFNAFARHAGAVIVFSAIGHLPGYLWSAFATGHSVPLQVLVSPLAGIVDLMCVMIGHGAIIYHVVQGLPGHPASMARTVGVAARRLLPLVSVLAAVVALWWLVRGLLMREFVAGPAVPPVVAWFGLVSTLIHGLVMAAYFLAAPVWAVEGVSVGAALSRGRFLTMGHRWKILGAMMLVGFLEFVMATIVLAVALPVARTVQLWEIGSIAIGGMWFVAGAFNAVLAAAFYARLRLIKDGVHIAKVFD